MQQVKIIQASLHDARKGHRRELELQTPGAKA
jgi:hypothetical protein